MGTTIPFRDGTRQPQLPGSHARCISVAGNIRTGGHAPCSSKAKPRRNVPRQGILSHRVPRTVFERAGRSSTLAPRVLSASQTPSRPMPASRSYRAAVRARCRSKPMRWSTAGHGREPQFEDRRLPTEQGRTRRRPGSATPTVPQAAEVQDVLGFPSPSNYNLITTELS